MRRGRRGKWACISIGIGLVIIFALVLPAQFWWYLFAGLMISAGLWYLRGC